MSNVVKISVEEQKGFAILNDCTGLYSPKNTGGYGYPNLSKKDIISAILHIEPPSAKDDYPYQIELYPNFPNQENNGFEITPSMMDMDELESGQYKFKLVVTFEDKNGVKTTSTAYATEVFIKTVECCVDKMNAGGLKLGSLSDPKQRLITELNIMLSNANRLIGCGLYGKANEIIELLKAHCECCGCK